MPQEFTVYTGRPNTQDPSLSISSPDFSHEIRLTIHRDRDDGGDCYIDIDVKSAAYAAAVLAMVALMPEEDL